MIVQRPLIAVLGAVGVLLGACSSGDTASDTASTLVPESTTAPPTVSTPPPDAGTAPAPTTTAPPQLSTFRLAAPPDCGTNPFCADGLARTYGIDVRGLIVPTDPGAPIAAAVRDGSADVGVLFSDDPELSAGDLVVLDDDLGMVAAENILPWARTALVEARGEGLRTALDDISSKLTEDDLRAGLAALRAGADPAEVAAGFAAVTGDPVEVAEGEPLRIGAEAFGSDRLLAHVYALGLTARGIPAEVVELGGYRALEVAAMNDGEIDLAVEYAASLLEYVDGYEGRASADTAATVAALREVLALADFEAFEPSPLQSRNLFVMRADVAERNSIGALSDLVPLAPAAEVSEPPGELPALDDPFAIFGADDLRVGSSGPAVRELQELLASIGYDPGPLNGVFEEPTRRAVAHFQVDVGTAPDGVVGPLTLQALRDAVAAGATATTSELTTTEGSGADEIHLTFDDGPNSRFTPQILDLLAQYDAKAVFFNIGNQVEGNADLLRRLVDEGHKVGNHTWDHASLDGMSEGTFADEIGRTQDAIERVTGVRPSCLRPPYGATDDTTRARAEAAGLTVELWNVDPQDWARPGTDVIVANVVQHAGGGDVVLMHDGGGDREQTIAALGQVLEQLSAEGYRFTPIPGC